ncbi:MAG: sigma 54-interacting transcriptional regulator [Calditrichia bacterium]
MNFKTLYIGDTEKLSQLKLLNNIANHAMFSSSRKENALAIATREKPDWLLIDFDCVECEPLDFLRQVRSELPDLKMIGLAENPGVNLIMQATRSGINEFVRMSDASQKLADILRDLQHSQTELDRGQAFHRRVKSELDFSNIIGDSEPMQRVFEVLRKVTHRKWVTVLVRGETGTGKELIAKALHHQCFGFIGWQNSLPCRSRCGSLRLFGYEKGAFTDAKTRKIGLFEAAQNDAIFSR